MNQRRPVPASLAAALAAVRERTRGFGANIVYYDSVGSTNDVASRLAAEGAPEGTLVVARAQTAGRGRSGRVWYSPAGAGLYFSLVFRPEGPAPAANATWLTLLAGVAVAEAVEAASGVHAEIKWPNDLVVVRHEGGRVVRRKVAGILAEGSVRGDRVLWIVLGVGINLDDAPFPPDLADLATSLGREAARVIEGGGVLAECVATIATRWGELCAGGRQRLLADWRHRSPSAVGRAVDIETPDGPTSGVTAGIDDEGALLVATGRLIRRVVAGEVRWR